MSLKEGLFTLEVEKVARGNLGWNPLSLVDKLVCLHIPEQEVYEETNYGELYKLLYEVNLITKVLNVHFEINHELITYEFQLQSVALPAQIKMRNVSTNKDITPYIMDVTVGVEALIEEGIVGPNPEEEHNKVDVNMWSNPDDSYNTLVWKPYGYLLEVDK